MIENNILSQKLRILGAENEISSDPQCKDDNAQYTIVSLKALCDKKLEINVYYFNN